MRIRSRMRKLFAMNATGINNTNHVDLDLREEYANAFRTESYIEFWTNVLAFSQGNSSPCNIMGSTSSTRLLSYRLFVEHLLDPDQVTVTRILESTRIRTEHRSLLISYFEVTAEASLLCSFLLKDVDEMRRKYKSLKASLNSFHNAHFSPKTRSPKLVMTRLTEFSNSPNPFVPSASSPSRFRAMQADCAELLKKLELSRDRTQSKLRLVRKIQLGSAIFLGALTVSLTVVLAVHAIAILVAAPSLMAPFIERLSTKKLAKWSTQLDVAAKGAYILIKDLDTISRLVARLNDELEDMHVTARFWLEKSKDQLQAGGEVAAQQLKKNDISFIEQLDELEEHLYLCFMTINRARSLVIKEISETGRPNLPSNLLPKE
ncbi:PREDICTED: UPF0496 protein At3g49070-like [Ipomoea nil]|uniref:UPF0496 protein At3g49070-like n=1 Tax=Ipomoea nil TaxID=35883 RepID=UPI0009009589|nr:PREDICTED: UPF0496 protein At3g49070-like [Ipomoea nil]